MNMRLSKIILTGLGISLLLAACATVNSARYERPVGSTAYAAEAGDQAELVAFGETLWNDTELGATGLACQNCHMNNAQFKESFRNPYPHHVVMPEKRAGLAEVTAEQMVQFCMTMPLGAEPLPWDSKELAALTAYVETVVQPEFASSPSR